MELRQQELVTSYCLDPHGSAETTIAVSVVDVDNLKFRISTADA